MRPVLVAFLLLLPAAPFASALNLPEAITHYRPAALPNGCMVEAVVFADWFMTRKFDGPNSWAQAVFIEPHVQGRKLAHAVAIFRHRGEFFLWDIEWGCLRLPQASPADGSLARVAGQAYAAHLTVLADRARRGARPARREASTASAPLHDARARLRSTRPTLLVELQGRETIDALAFVVEGRLMIYHPDRGTLAAPFAGRDIEAALSRFATEWAFDGFSVRMDSMTLPPPEDEVDSAKRRP